MIRRGFTVVELVITITVMGILLTLAVVNLNATQANGRDSERKADAESIATYLETYQSTQDPNIPYSGLSYPSTTVMTTNDIGTYLVGISAEVTHAPDVDTSSPISIVPAQNALTTTAGVLPQPSNSNDVYVYQPLTSSGTLCTDLATSECRRFNLYYFQENGGGVQVVRSKAQ